MIKYIVIAVSVFVSTADAMEVDTRLDKVLKGYKQVQVRCLAVLKNGHLAAGTQDGMIHIWDVEKGNHLRKFGMCRNFYAVNNISDLIVLNNGNIASGNWHGAIRILNPETGDLLKQFDGGQVRCLVELTGERIASGTFDGAIHIWDIETEKLLKTVTAKKNMGVIRHLAETDSGLISESKCDTLRLWDIETGKLRKKYKGHIHPTGALIQLNDGRIVHDGYYYTGSYNVWIKDCKKKEVIKLVGHTADISCAVELGKGQLATGSWDETIRIWNINSK